MEAKLKWYHEKISVTREMSPDGSSLIRLSRIDVLPKSADPSLGSQGN